MHWQRDRITDPCNKPIPQEESCAMAAVSRQQGLYFSPRGIQKIAEQAFWDVLAEGLDQKPPQWERLLTLLEEARSMLLELIPENAQEGKQLRANVLEKLDMVRPSAHQGMHAVSLLPVRPVQVPRKYTQYS